MTEIECVAQPSGRKFCKPSPCLVFAMVCEAMFLDLVSSVYYLRDILQRPEVSPRSFKLIYTKEWHERYHSFKLPGRGNFVQHLLLNWSDVKFGHDYNVFNTETAGRFVEGWLAWLMVSDDSDDWSEAKHALATAWLRTIDALLAVLLHQHAKALFTPGSKPPLPWKRFGNFYRKPRPESKTKALAGIDLTWIISIQVLFWNWPDLAGPWLGQVVIVVMFVVTCYENTDW